MADAGQLKERVRAYIQALKADRQATKAQYDVELTRLDAQINAAQLMLQNWNTGIDDMIGLLNQAGIRIEV